MRPSDAEAVGTPRSSAIDRPTGHLSVPGGLHH